MLDNGYWDTTTSSWKGITGSTIDTTNKTITFTVNHFTTFGVLTNENQNVTVNNPSASSGASSNTNSPSSCGDQAPANAPYLFEIRRTGDKAKLYFAPARDPVSYYFIAYGTKDNPHKHGVSFDQGHSSGVLTFTINKLNSADYYFKIRAGNGCMPGPWSNTMLAKAGRTSYYSGASVATSITKKTTTTPATKVSKTLTTETISTPSPAPAPVIEEPSKPTPTPTPAPGFWRRLLNRLLGK